MRLDAYLPERRWDGVPVQFGMVQKALESTYEIAAIVSRHGEQVRSVTVLDMRTVMLCNRSDLVDLVERAMDKTAAAAVLDWRRALWAGWANALRAGEV